MRNLKSTHPHKTLYFRIQRGFREFKAGVQVVSFIEAWRVLYPILSNIRSECPWGITLDIAPTDRYTHGAMAIRFVIRFKVGNVFKDCCVLLSSNENPFTESVTINTSQYNTFLEWKDAVTSNTYLRSIAKTLQWDKAVSYTRL